LPQRRQRPHFREHAARDRRQDLIFDTIRYTKSFAALPGAANVEMEVGMVDELVARGVAIKEEMWGPEHGWAKLERSTGFNREFEELVAKYCFAEVWGREQLPRATRSMLTIAILVALGRGPEVKVHVEAAINNGVTTDELREVLIHAAVYCGIPAAVDGFRSAMEVLERMGVE
jgi:4-carboxymuconolactone decarboxylase